MPTIMRSLTHPSGFTRLHRSVSAIVLSLYLGAAALWYVITDNASTGEVAFKFGYVTFMWLIIRVFLIMPWAERSETERRRYSWAD